jgi:hypothetical protein
VAKDRAAPFSKKHRRTWIPVTGGMILLGMLNVGVGIYLYRNGPKDVPRTDKEKVLPRYYGGPALDAGVLDATPTPR